MAKSKEQIESDADIARRKSVDAKYKKDAAKEKERLAKLATTPLSNEELAFCLATEARMNKGRRAEMPCPADVMRYSNLKGRMGIKAPAEDAE